MRELHLGHSDLSQNADMPYDEQDILPGKAPPGKGTTGHRKRKEKRKRKGRPRGKRSMGRYPFLTELTEYINEQRPFRSRTTLHEEERKLRLVHKHVQELKRQGKMSTTNPKKMTERDIGEYIYFLKHNGLALNTQVKYMQHLTNFLILRGNPYIAKIKARNKMPRKKNKRLPTISYDEVMQIIEASQGIEGWMGTVCAFIIPFHYYSALRASELRLAHLEDLDTEMETIWVRFPKGYEKGAEQRTVNLAPEVMPYVYSYLKARAERLEELGIKRCPYLIPQLTHKNTKAEPYHRLWKYAKAVQELAGIEFNLQGLRRACGQHLKDRDISMDYISKHLGHESIKTTQDSYVEIGSELVRGPIRGAWSRQPVTKYSRN